MVDDGDRFGLVFFLFLVVDFLDKEHVPRVESWLTGFLALSCRDDLGVTPFYSHSLQVGNLPSDIRAREIEDIFYKAGDVVDCDVRFFCDI
jgi:hypothetical protein